MQSTVIVKDRQTLLDIAIQCGGSVEGVFSLAALNGLSITSKLTTGQELLLPPAMNEEVVTYYKVNELTPASGDTKVARSRGINFDRIEGPEPILIVYP